MVGDALTSDSWNSIVDAVSELQNKDPSIDTLSVKEFGAVGDGFTDDSTAIQAAIYAAGITKKRLKFGPHTYVSNAELKTTDHGIELEGCGLASGARTIIKCGTYHNGAVFKTTHSYVNVRGIHFDANHQAKFALQLEGSSFSIFENDFFSNATDDGINLSVIGINDANVFYDPWVCNNGRIHCTPGFDITFDNYRRVPEQGRVACSRTNEIITGTGTRFLAMGIRSGDYIRIGSGLMDDEFLQISEVLDNTHLRVGVAKLPIAIRSDQHFAIAVGCGYKEVRHNDNNITHIVGGLWRLNAGAAMQFTGLYGPTITHPQIDLNGFYGIVIGTTDQEVCFASHIDHPYFEGNLAAPILFGCALGVTVNQPQYGYGSPDKYHIASPSNNVGVWIDYDGIQEIGNGYSTVPTSRSWSSFQLGGTFIHSVVNPGTPVAGTTITVNGSNLALPCIGNVTMTAKPTLSTGSSQGQQLIIHNQSGGNITFQDEAVLPGSKLKLLRPTITLSIYDSMTLIWVAAGYWMQIADGVRIK